MSVFPAAFLEQFIHSGSDALLNIIANENDDPKTSPGVSIELRFEEGVPDEWPDTAQQALDEIIQTDPLTELNFSIAHDSPKIPGKIREGLRA